MKVEVLKTGRAMFSVEHRRDLVIWLAGIALSFASAGFFSLALKMTDKSSIVSSLAGVGLFALFVFSHTVLKERVGIPEISGGLLIIAGTILVGVFEPGHGPEQVYSQSGLAGSLAGTALFFAALVAGSLKTGRFHGIVFGALAGAFIGVGIIFTDIALVTVDGDMLAQLTTPYPYIALLFAASALATTQFAFFRGRAVEVVPCVNSFLILTPLVLEYFTFRIRLAPIQYAAVAVIIAGVLVLSSRGANKLA